MNSSNLFANATRLPSIPKLVQEIIESFDDPDANLDDISKKIEQEPVISAKILRLANSAHFGQSRTVASVNDATILIGHSAMRTLALASGMIDSLSIPEALDRKQFWFNAFEVAGCAKWLTKFGKGMDPNAAFTAGLIHSIGQLLMYAAEPELASKVQEKINEGQGRASAENEVFGYTNPDAGAELAKRWKFPEGIHQGIMYQDLPEKATGESEIAYLIYISKILINIYKDKPEPKEVIASIKVPSTEALPINLAEAAEALAEQEDFSGGIEALLS